MDKHAQRLREALEATVPQLIHQLTSDEGETRHLAHIGLAAKERQPYALAALAAWEFWSGEAPDWLPEDAGEALVEQQSIRLSEIDLLAGQQIRQRISADATFSEAIRYALLFTALVLEAGDGQG